MALEITSRTRRLQNEIDEYLDCLSDAALAFGQAAKMYLSDGVSNGFSSKLKQVAELESRGDELRRAVETEMYVQTLLPESRADVLELMERLDQILNLLEEALWYFDIEKPDIPDEFDDQFVSLIDSSVSAVEALGLAARAYFRDAASIKDHLHKVRFYEKDGDETLTKLKRAIFAQDFELARKIHLRLFAEGIAEVSDMAEDVADRLVIFSIKRTP